VDKKQYQSIIKAVSDELSEKFIRVEQNLAKRAPLIDQDIAEIVREIGLETTKKVFEKTRDSLVLKKTPRTENSEEPDDQRYNVVFGPIELDSPYLWRKSCRSKPLVDIMGISHQGRSIGVERALSDFGIEESFACAAKRFKEHYHYELSPTTVDRTTQKTAQQA